MTIPTEVSNRVFLESFDHEKVLLNYSWIRSGITLGQLSFSQIENLIKTAGLCETDKALLRDFFNLSEG